eukprot:gb/GEZN01004526.1/.p1 GENE.gb/GEZN01004526.1/~~gb/GEZN01004526.1/.p1  ORF type:complete len:590 (-),score=43.54 gb/GEZN01004526.1/:182-1897(-)
MSMATDVHKGDVHAEEGSREHCLACRKMNDLLKSEECPDYLQCRYITSGYRHNLGWWKALRSIFEWHNETLNIWTHFIGFGLMLFISFTTLTSLSPFGVDHLRSSWPSHFLPNLDTYHYYDNRQGNNNNNGLGADKGFFRTGNFGNGNYQACPASCPVRPHMTDLQRAVAEQQEALIGEDYRGFCARAPETRAKLILRYLSAHSEQLHAILSHLLPDLTQSSSPNRPEKFNHKITAQARHYGHLITETLARWREAVVHAADLGSHRTDKLGAIQEELQGFVHSALEAANFTYLAYSLGVRKHDFLQTSQQLLHNFTEHLSRVTAGPHESNTANTREKLAELFAPLSTSTPSDGNIGDYSVITANFPAARVVGYLPRWPFAIFIITALICFGMSSSFHLFLAVSQQAFSLFQTLDYAGIVLLIGGSTFPVIYYGFFCRPLLQGLYLSFLTSLCILVFTVLLLPRFKDEEYRLYKVGLFVSQALSGVCGVFHFMLLEGEVPTIFWYLLAMGTLYLSGAAIYLLRCPESCVPGKFDIWGHSHQWWHIIVVLAAFVEFYGLLDMFHWRMEHRCVT